MTQNSFHSLFSLMTDEQKEAALHTTGPALVIAGAGSGKTRVVTMRVASLLHQGVDPSSLVAVTFTNKAAQEMRERIEHLAGKQVLVSTFHSLGARILRSSIHHLGYSNDFVIYDEGESEKVLKSVLKELFGPTQEVEVDDFRRDISAIKNGSSAGIGPDSERVYEAYQAALQRSQAVDFDDLIHLPIRLMKEKEEVLSELQAQWKYILVDEYQDANDAQSQFALLLAGRERNIFAVGDPDQSIYSWRGANIQHILQFQKQFPEARLFYLNQNFRSTNTILAASNDVIQNNSKRLDKSLWSALGEGEKIGCFVARTEREEASFIGDSVEEMIEGQISPQNIAVLYRTNAQSRSIEDAFLERGIAYKVFGGLSFYERKEVRDILAYLRLLLQPFDAMAFERAASTPKRGLGSSTLQKVVEVVQEKGVSFLDFLREFPQGTFSGIKLGEKQKQGFLSLYEGLRQAQTELNAGRLSQTIFHLMNDTGYLSSLEGDQETFLERRENITQVLVKAKEWEEEHPEEHPRLFLETMLLNADKESASRKEGGQTVFLMTVHNAKGLEFDSVFISGLEETLFPHIHSRKEGADDEEERRLFYVAMTRARKYLTISCAQVRFLWGTSRRMSPSRFLREISREYLHPLRGPCFKPKVSTEKIQFGSSLVKKEERLSSGTEKICAGCTVFHPQFGIGRVESIHPSQQGEMIKVFFVKEAASKTLLKDVAPLRIVQG